jgi:hypothetical protein
MKPWAAAVIVTLAIALVTGAVVLYPPAGTGGTSSSSTSSTSTLASNGLQLRLALDATNIPPGGSLGVKVSEFNTRSVANNVTKADLWSVQGLSLGACATEGYSIYPFGVAVYQGKYTVANLSEGTPLQIFPEVPCPMLLRLVTGYLFQPLNDSAVILPSSGSLATPMNANVTVDGEYSGGSLQPLSPGVYTVAAGDEWGALEAIQFTVGRQAQSGTLAAQVSIGPTAPVCMTNATTGPAPYPYSSIEAVVTPSSGANTTVPVDWTSNGCEVSGSFHVTLSPGTYTLNLSSCTYMGCGSALPKAFTIYAGQTSDVTVSIDTGIR